MVGTGILVKQTTGLILSLIFIFYKILVAKGKEDWKNVVKIIAVRLLGVLIPVILFLIYLLKNNIINEFLDYAIYGIKEFSNYIPYTDLFKYYGIHIAILAVVIPLTILYMHYRAIIKEEKSSIFVLFAYSCASITAVYPISDNIHFSIAILPAFIGLIYILHELFKGKIKKRMVKEILKSIIDIAIISVIVISVVTLTKYIINCRKYDNLNHFKYIPYGSSLEKEILDVGNFVEDTEKSGKKVYILDATAAIFMIPIDRYNKDFDMFLLGNLGQENIKVQVENLEQEEDLMVLIPYSEDFLNWQHPKDITNSIIKDWKNVGQVERFNIYIKEEKNEQ